MRFFIGALALAVICVLFGLPAAVVLGWIPITASERKVASTSVNGRAPSVPNRVATQ